VFPMLTDEWLHLTLYRISYSRENIMYLFWKYLVDLRSEAWLNLFWEYINGKLFAVYIDGAIPSVDDDHDGDVAEHHHRQGQDPGQARHKHRVEELLTKLEHYQELYMVISNGSYMSQGQN